MKKIQMFFGIMAILVIATPIVAIDPDTNIRLDPHPDHISYYTNSTYITCAYTIEEEANVTIKFERFNITNNSTDVMTDFGEFAINTTNSFNITAANFSTVGRYRAAMYAIDGKELCTYWIVVRSNTSSNYGKLHGSVRFTNANSVPTVSFIEPMGGRGTTWAAGSISLTHSLELWVFDTNWTAATGGNHSIIDYTNKSGNTTKWVLAQTYTLGRWYMMLIYSHDYELLDMHLVQAVVPDSNVVEVIARDIETDEQIMTFSATMTDITKTASDGKVLFTNVTNGEHLITVTADDYMTGTQTIYMENNYVNTTVYLQRYSPYVPPHYIRFYLVNLVMQPYEDVTVTATYTSASNGTTTLTEVTGTDGAVVFLLTPTFKHTIRFLNASQGIDKTVTLYPKDTEYWITVGAGEPWSDYEHDPTRYITIHVTQREINDSHAFINVTYRDDLNKTTALRMWINQTNMSDILGNETMIDSWDSPSNNNSTSHSFMVTNYRGQDYKVQVWHEHDEFGTTYTRAIRFAGMLIDLGLPTIAYAYISFALLFFVGAMFGATSTSTGSIVTCVMGWVLYSIGWLGILGITGPICLALASTYAVGSAINHAARRGGYA